MNLMFWKKKTKAEADSDTSQEAGDDRTVAMEVPDLDAPAKPGLLSRVRSGYASLASRFRKTPAPDTESEEKTQAPSTHGSAASKAGEQTPAIRHMRSKKRLIIGGAIGLLILVLAGAGIATWKIFLSPSPHEAATPATADTSHDAPSADQAKAEHADQEQASTAQSETHQDEIEALRKKNEELQAQIEALKKEQPPEQSSATAPGAAGENTASAASTGELTISNKDPKAAAQALKEAIEAMNSGSGGSARKPAK